MLGAGGDAPFTETSHAGRRRAGHKPQLHAPGEEPACLPLHRPRVKGIFTGGRTSHRTFQMGSADRKGSQLGSLDIPRFFQAQGSWARAGE